MRIQCALGCGVASTLYYHMKPLVILDHVLGEHLGTLLDAGAGGVIVIHIFNQDII